MSGQVPFCTSCIVPKNVPFSSSSWFFYMSENQIENRSKSQIFSLFLWFSFSFALLLVFLFFLFARFASSESIDSFLQWCVSKITFSFYRQPEKAIIIIFVTRCNCTVKSSMIFFVSTVRSSFYTPVRQAPRFSCGSGLMTLTLGSVSDVCSNVCPPKNSKCRLE